MASLTYHYYHSGVYAYSEDPMEEENLEGHVGKEGEEKRCIIALHAAT